MNICSGVHVDAHHVSMVSVTHTTPSPGATMRAAVLVEPGHIEMQERPIPTPTAGDVLIRVSSVGVCGSDTHYYRDGRVGSFVVDAPLVLGHEAAGTIVAVGDAVDRARIGQRVSIEPQRPDPDTDETRRGHYNLCPHMRVLRHAAGGRGALRLRDHRRGVRPSRARHRCPTTPPRCVSRCRWASPRSARPAIDGGSRVLIAGAGPIGIVVDAARPRLRRHRDRRHRSRRVPPRAGPHLRRDNGARPDRRPASTT